MTAFRFRTRGSHGLPLLASFLFVIAWSLDAGGLCPAAGAAWREPVLWALLALFVGDALWRARRGGWRDLLARRRASTALLGLALLGAAVLGAAHLTAAAGGASPPPTGLRAPLLVVALWALSLLELGDLNHSLARRRVSPAVGVLAGFISLILLGGLLLLLPAAHAPGRSLGVVDALFTATSAVCVTGLTVVDTGAAFSRFGQGVLLALFQAGGLGILTVTSFFALLMFRDLSVREALALRENYRTGVLRGLGGLLGRVVGLTFAVEAAGALLIWLTAGPRPGAGAGAPFSAVFHAVSAFCNAGFALRADSLAAWRGGGVVVVAALIMLGGLGFLVLFEIGPHLHARLARRRPRRLSLQARLVLGASLLLWVGGAVLIHGVERGGALAGLPAARAWLVAAFHAVTPRTAGFAMLPVGELAPASFLVTLLLMFIGGAPGSTAGGVKVTTVALVLLLLAAYLRGHDRVELAGRRVGNEVLRLALAVLGGGLLVVTLGTLALLLIAPVALDRAVFEVVSAFGTVGLSTGLSAELGAGGKLLLALLMFLGRVGPLTVVLAVGGAPRVRPWGLPAESVAVG
ncbi:MAG: hypothetical protein JW819_12940 [Candidatus Krumholzibacteriota bacterium]|nr:hypothetical protein [Candidatus Krumholzibacteriota bacterium]